MLRQTYECLYYFCERLIEKNPDNPHLARELVKAQQYLGGYNQRNEILSARTELETAYPDVVWKHLNPSMSRPRSVLNCLNYIILSGHIPQNLEAIIAEIETITVCGSELQRHFKINLEKLKKTCEIIDINNAARGYVLITKEIYELFGRTGGYRKSSVRDIIKLLAGIDGFPIRKIGRNYFYDSEKKDEITSQIKEIRMDAENRKRMGLERGSPKFGKKKTKVPKKKIKSSH